MSNWVRTSAGCTRNSTAQSRNTKRCTMSLREPKTLTAPKQAGTLVQAWAHQTVRRSWRRLNSGRDFVQNFLAGCPRVVRASDLAADHQVVGAAGDGFGGCGHSFLVALSR